MKNTIRAFGRMISIGVLCSFLADSMAQPTPVFSWVKGNLGGYATPFSIDVDSMGYTYVLGNFQGNVDFSPYPDPGQYVLSSPGASSIYLAKYDATGDVVWAKRITTPSQPFIDIWEADMAVDRFGNSYVTGYFQGEVDFDPGPGVANLGAVYFDMYFAKYDPEGNYVWAKKLNGAGIGVEMGESIKVDANGNIYIAGSYGGFLDLDPGPGQTIVTQTDTSRNFLAKYDNAGNLIWGLGLNNMFPSWVNPMALDGYGNVYLTGYVEEGGNGQDDIVVKKYDANGGLAWSNQMGNPNNNETGLGLSVDASGNVYLAGFFHGTTDFDPGAGTANLTSDVGYESFLAKYDASGNFMWGNRMVGGRLYDDGLRMAMNSKGVIGVTNVFSGTLDFDPGPGAANISSTGDNDIYMALYDSLGGYLNAWKIGGPGWSWETGIVFNGKDELSISGYLQNDDPDFDPGPNTVTLSLGAYSSFVASYSICSDPDSGGTIAAGHSGSSPFDPAAFTSLASPGDYYGSLEYKWQSSVTDSVSGFTDVAGSTTETYDPGPLTQTTWFKRLARVDCRDDWTGAAESNVLKVEVLAVKTWVGGEGDWNVGANWSDGKVPVYSDMLTVNSGNPRLDVDFNVLGSLTVTGTGGLTVNPGKTLSVGGTADFGNRPVTLLSDATGTAQLGEVTGTLSNATNVTVERYIPNTGRRWRLLTAPLDGITINSGWQNGQTWNGTAPLIGTTGTLITGQQQGNASTANSRGFDFWSAVANSSASVMSYSQRSGQGVWTPLSNTTPSNAFNGNKAYLLFVRGPRSSLYSTGTANAATTLRPTGRLRQGDIDVTVDGTKGYTMVGNPYASQVDFDKIYQNTGNGSVIKRQFWMWDATNGTSGNFQAVVYSGGRYVEVPMKFHTAGQSSPLTAIQSGHGFFVLPLTTAGGTMRIRESNKIATTSASPNILLSDDKTPRVFVNLMKRDGDGSDVLADGVMVSYGEGYSMQATDADDAPKLYNLGENLAVVNGDNLLIADARPMSDIQRPVGLRLWNAKPGRYRFEAKAEGMAERGIKAFLEDRLTGRLTPLEMNGDVTSIEMIISEDNASKAEDRFRIVFEKASVNASLTPEPEPDGRRMTVYPNPLTDGRSLTVRLQGLPAGSYTLQLTASDGRVVATRRVEHGEGTGTYRIYFITQLPKGNYLLICSVGGNQIDDVRLMVQ
jgi:hypothetical protein